MFTVYQNLCMMTEWGESKTSLIKKVLIQRYWANSVNKKGWSRPVLKYSAYTVNEFTLPLTIKRQEYHKHG